MTAVLDWFRRWRAARAERSAAERARAEAEAAAEAEHAEEQEAAEAAGEGAGGEDEGVDAALTEELDLHTFLPKECADVVGEYLRAAQEAGFSSVRIVHGKGTGAMRRTVHAVLDRHPAVRSYQLAGAARGSWGATLVELKPRGEAADEPQERSDTEQTDRSGDQPKDQAAAEPKERPDDEPEGGQPK